MVPANRLERWKKLWATPRLLEDEATNAAFDEFIGRFVPTHMHKQFLKFFGQPKAQFGNRFFMEDSVYQNWDTKLASLGAGTVSHVEVTVIYGSPTELQAYGLRGEPRRSLHDIVIDDWHSACAIVRAGDTTIYVFVEPKMKGCVIRVTQTE